MKNLPGTAMNTNMIMTIITAMIMAVIPIIMRE